ncbi:hypothetical protein PAXINDRAFT_13065 [Paxillus involutus ATCC 200175]|uniref:Uncharacterized protein n=1 Tax=Paxillus involutus ATCC 200175 TaxID=664439 RepID=A0A0C9U4N5_PAXIN|nr:hypothetical protein PAXINDRAFT_13065 [Paxillus involutus ATCC 200175]
MSKNSDLQKALAHSISEVLQSMVFGNIVRENDSRLAEDKLQKPRYYDSVLQMGSMFKNKIPLQADDNLNSIITEDEIKLLALTITHAFLNPCCQQWLQAE